MLEIICCEFAARDAFEYCTYLQTETCRAPQYKIFLLYTFTTDYIIQVVIHIEDSKSNLQTLIPLMRNKIMLQSMVKKMSLSGLAMHYLQFTYQREWLNGVHILLNECFQKKTKSDKTHERYYMR